LGCPQNIFWGKQKLKIWLKIWRMGAYNFGARGSNLTKLFQLTCREAGMIRWVQFLGGLPPPRIWDGKNRPKIVAILCNFTLRSRISPERMKISTSGKATDQIRSLPRSTKKFGEVWSTNKKVIGVHVDPPKVKLFDRMAKAC